MKADIFNPEIISGLLILSCIIGLGAGIYPSLLLSGFSPVSTLKGIFRPGFSKVELRKYLVVVQFAISVIMIVSTLIVYFQLDYMKNSNLGFDKEQKLIVPADFSKKNFRTIKNEFLRHHSIKGAVGSSTIPGRENSTWSVWLKGVDYSQVVFNMLTVDYDFLSEYKLEVIAGEEFRKDMVGSASKICAINETGAKMLGFDFPEKALQKEIHAADFDLKIIGIVKDFHYRGLQQKIDPLLFILPIPRYGNLRMLTLTIDTQNLAETLEFVEKKWNELNLGAIFSYRFLDEDFNRLYRTEEKAGQIFSTFTALGLFIAFLGLFGLALFTVGQRTKEIGIRKTLGATVSSIIILLTKEFIKWVILGIIIAFPIAYYAMDRWLQNFAYRIDIGLLPFIGAAGIAIVLSLLTVSLLTLKAAALNPAEALRVE